MVDFVILTTADADKVRGVSTKGNAIVPVPLIDGTLALPVEVLSDPAHAASASFLKSLPSRAVGVGTAGATPSAPVTGSEFATDPLVKDKYAYKSTWPVGQIQPVDAKVIPATK